MSWWNFPARECADCWWWKIFRLCARAHSSSASASLSLPSFYFVLLLLPIETSFHHLACQLLLLHFSLRQTWCKQYLFSAFLALGGARHFFSPRALQRKCKWGILIYTLITPDKGLLRRKRWCGALRGNCARLQDYLAICMRCLQFAHRFARICIILENSLKHKQNVAWNENDWMGLELTRDAWGRKDNSNSSIGTLERESTFSALWIPAGALQQWTLGVNFLLLIRLLFPN